MKRFLEKVGVAIASRIGIAAAISLVAAAALGGGYWWLRSQGPRETVKGPGGVKVDVEDMAFYGKDDTKVTGKVFRPSESLDEPRTAVIYCQSVYHGESWCRALAATGAVCYCFDFQGDGEKARMAELETVLNGIRALRHVDKDRVFLLGEGNGCLTASSTTFDNSRKVQGLILVSPGFNPLEISRKAKKYSHPILVVDDALGREANLEEIKDFID